MAVAGIRCPLACLLLPSPPAAQNPRTSPWEPEPGDRSWFSYGRAARGHQNADWRRESGLPGLFCARPQRAAVPVVLGSMSVIQGIGSRKTPGLASLVAALPALGTVASAE